MSAAKKPLSGGIQAYSGVRKDAISAEAERAMTWRGKELTICARCWRLTTTLSKREKT